MERKKKWSVAGVGAIVAPIACFLAIPKGFADMVTIVADFFRTPSVSIIALDVQDRRYDYVSVSVRNPMDRALSLSNVSLGCNKEGGSRVFYHPMKRDQDAVIIPGMAAVQALPHQVGAGETHELTLAFPKYSSAPMIGSCSQASIAWIDSSGRRREGKEVFVPRGVAIIYYDV